MLDKAYQDGDISLEAYEAAMHKLQATSATAGDAAYDGLKKLADEWLDQLEPMREYTRQLEQVEQALSRGLISPEQAEAIKKRMAEAMQPLNEADVWAVQAAKNIQDALGDNLFQILDGNFKSIGASFGNMLKRMVAEATAAQLSRALFGDFAKSGQAGGLLGQGLSWLGGALFGTQSPAPIAASVPTTVIPSHADGLDYVPYDGYLARLHRGERVQTAAEARSAGPSIIVTNHYKFASGLNVGEMQAWGEAIKNRTVADVKDQIRRGGWRDVL
jgi:hypothetical protein